MMKTKSGPNLDSRELLVFLGEKVDNLGEKVYGISKESAGA